PSSQFAPVRMYQNGQFFGLYFYYEAVDKSFIERNGLDADTGVTYKASQGSTADCRYLPIGQLPANYEKHRPYDDGDFNDLNDLLFGLNNLTGQAHRNFLFDNLDIPRILNYLAAMVVLHDNDAMGKNYYLYRDVAGTNRWYILPWDKDLTFGRNYDEGGVLNDDIWANVDYHYNATWGVSSPSHPLFGNQAHPKVDALWNRLNDKLFNEPDIRAMYLRRMRTIMDEQLQAPGTPYAQRIIEKRIDELTALEDTEAAMDFAKWGSWGQIQTISQAAQILKDSYLTVRRTHLFSTHCVDVNANGEIPSAQTTKPPIVINEIMYNPAGGDNDEFIELYNPSATEYVDMTGWQLSGVELTMPPGTVLPPLDYLVVVKNDVQFRSTYGSGFFVAAQYEGTLDNAGENLVLTDRQGNVIDEVYYSNGGFWPDTSGGYSLELIDASKNNNHPMNWESSVSVGGTPGAVNSRAGTFPYIPELKVNEVLSVNTALNKDEVGKYAPWIEIYNDTDNAVDLGGMFLTDDYNNPTKWAIPASTVLNSGQWMIFWADGNTNDGPLHTNFALNSAGGFVGLYTADGQNVVDYMNYGALAANISYGKYPDGVASYRIFGTPTPAAQNYVKPVPIILNEYTGVSDTKFLKNNGSDTYWGRVLGNGGDWFELVVTQDHLDIRGWKLLVNDNVGGSKPTSQTLTLTSNSLWSDLRAGTIITVSENLPDNISNYDPPNGKWWINVQSKTGASGTYITPLNIDVSNNNWQLTIKDSNGTTVFGPAGEGIQPVSGIGSDEVFHLEEAPGPLTSEHSNYLNSTMSTFGAPNIYNNGQVQDFSKLRVLPDIGAPTPNPMIWANAPTTTGSTSITMKATVASDTSGVEYYFECTSGGGHNSGWQSSPYYKDRGLTPNTIYSYRVKARDKSPAQNETASSSVGSAGTLTAISILGSWVNGLTHAKESGTNRGLVVIAHAERTSTSAFGLNSITYGGQAMTKIIDINTGSSTSRVCVSAYWLGETGIAAATSGTFVPTWSATPSDVNYISVFLGNVNQTTPIGAKGTSSTSSSATLSTSALVTNDGDMVFDAATCSNTGNFDVNNGFIKTYEAGDANFDVVGAYKAAMGVPEIPTATHSVASSRKALLGFVVDVIPVQATNPTPATASINVSLTPTLSWTAGTGATSHDVYFGAFNPGIFQGNQTGTAFSPGTLLTNTTYYWRVDEHNAGGTITGPVWSFTTIPPPPGQAVNPVPASGATYVGTTTDISWTAGAGATSHDVYFGTTNPPAFKVNQTATTYDTGTMANNTTYYWRIDEKNATSTVTGVVWSFTTQPAPPATSILGSWVTGTTHAKETAGTNRALVFIGHAEHSASTALNSVTYGGCAMTKVVERVISSGTTRTYVAAFILNDAGINAATSTTFTPTWSATPSYGTAYASVFLQNVNQTTLTGANASNQATTGATITTSALANSSGDMIIDAATNSNTGTYTTNNSFTKAVDLSVSNFDGVAGYKSATGASETPSVTHSTSTGRQSLIGFVVKGIPPAKATNPSPANVATNVAVTTDLSWTPGTGATSHDVYFGTTNPPTFQGNQTTGVTFDTGTMAKGTTYYWRIDEKNAGGTTTGDVWSFTTIVAVPGQTSAPIPANGATGLSVTTDLSWTAGSGATSHDVYFDTVNPPSFVLNQTGTTYDTGTMANGTTYYWRIDEKNPGGTTTGDVWSFTTIVSRTLNVSSNDGGNVTTPGEGDFQYDNGTNTSIVATADANYHFVNWTGTAVTAGKVAGPTSASTTVLMDADYTVVANFVINQLAITASAGANGSISPSGTFNKDYGSSQLFTATPTTGYEIDKWKVDGVEVQTGGTTYTLSGITATHTVAVSFRILTYTVTGSAGANGAISPSGTINKDYGSSQLFTATPFTGYEVDTWQVDGADVQTGGTTYMLSNITAAHTVAVSFKARPAYTITGTAGANGSITPANTVVYHGDNQLFTATSDIGYEVDIWQVDGADVQTGGNTYILSNITADHTVAVMFKIRPVYAVTGTAGANGSITPTSADVYHGDSQLFTATPTTGYEVDKWTVDGGDVQAGGTTYTLSNITAGHTVAVSFKIMTYTVTASAGANGSIDPTSTVVNYDGSQLFTATPTTGYEVDKWKVDGADVQTGGTAFTLSNITANHTVAVSFKIMTYTVTGTAGANGSINPTSAVVNYNSGQLFTAISDTGYEVDTWQLDGADAQTGGSTYTLSNITATHTVAVTFKAIPTYTVTGEAGANGSISPTSEVVYRDGSQLFTATPGTCYEVDKWQLDGVDIQTGGTTYTLSNITANHTVTVSFKIRTYIVNTSEGISPPGPIVKDCGSSQLFTTSPVTGYEIDKWQVDGADVQTGGTTFTLSNITANHTVAVSFKIMTYAITGTAGANGSISPSETFNKDYGSSQLFTAMPTTGYSVDTWQVDGADVQTGGTTFTLSNITAAHTVAVSFKILTYTVTASAGANGSVAPTSSVVNYGGSQLFTATANTDYIVNKWQVDGADVQTGGNTYTITNVTATHAVTVSFVVVSPSQASNPTPANSATNVAVTTDLSWTAGARATSHDVYFGTASTPPLVSSSQTGTTYDTGTMANGTTYYWRIDEKNAGGTTTGTVWSFTTIVAVPAQATTPSPATGATGVSITSTLSWTAGARATSHDVYFGTASTPPLVSSSQTGTTYSPGTLGYSTTYYWRIDEKNAGGTTTGTVWSFTTTQAPLVSLLGSWGSGLTHTKASGTNRGLIFIAHGELVSASMNLSAVTYGGQAMTKVVERNYNAASGNAYVAAYILNETGVAAATNTNFVVTWSGTAPSEVGYASAFFSNVNQTTSVGATGSGGSTTNPVTTSALATTSGDMVILGATCGNAGSYTLNNSFTEGIDQAMASSTGVTGHKAATGANETPSATYSSTINRQTIIGLVVKHQ
ncbi:MAG: CotH kinase family protein, partial [Sedimentisphaerales bacterium]